MPTSWMRFAAGQVAQCKTNSFPFVLGVRSLPPPPFGVPPPSIPIPPPHREDTIELCWQCEWQAAWQKHNMKGTQYAIFSTQYPCRCLPGVTRVYNGSNCGSGNGEHLARLPSNQTSHGAWRFAAGPMSVLHMWTEFQYNIRHWAVPRVRDLPTFNYSINTSSTVAWRSLNP